MAEAEIVAILSRMFPSFRGLDPNETARRADALGQFGAQAWRAGPQGLQAKGIPVGERAHAALLPLAGQVVQAGRGGTSFLDRTRAAMADDGQFAKVLSGLARAYAEAMRGGGAPSPAAAAPLDLAPAPAGGGGGGLDLAPLDLAPTPSRAPAPGRAPQPAASGGLDLAPLDLAPAPAPAGGGGGGLDLAPETDDEGPRPSVADLLYGAEDPADAVARDAGAPEDPAAKALWCYERTGEVRFLDEADQALQADLRSAPHATAAAFAEAGLARVALLRGDGPGAQRLAKSALGRDPSNPLAVEVLVRASRGEANEAKLLRSLQQLSAAIAQRDVGKIVQSAQGMIQGFPEEPFGYLGLCFAAHLRQESEAFQRYLKQAWEHYPSEDNAHRTFGGEVDADLADVIIHWGREPLRTMEPDLLRKTVVDIDSKDNVIAGSLRMGVGLARIALTAGPQRPLARRLHFAIGQGLMGLQYFEAAPEAFGKALLIGPSPEEVKAAQKERLQCQALWRAFDKPGIKAQQKKYKCLGASGMADTLRRRLESIRNDKKERQNAVYSKAPALAERAASDPALAKDMAEAADAYSIPNPLTTVQALERELAQIAKDMAGDDAAAKKAKAKKTSLFGKLKDAAGQVSSAAKGAALKLKESQVRAKRDDAVRNMAVIISRDLADHPFKHPMLAGFARQAAVLEAFTDYLDAEERRCQKNLAQLAE